MLAVSQKKKKKSAEEVHREEDENLFGSPFPYFRVYSYFEFYILQLFNVGLLKAGLALAEWSRVVWWHPCPGHFSESISESAWSL